MRFELTTSTLARLRSTPELHPQWPLKRRADNSFCFGVCKTGVDFIKHPLPNTRPLSGPVERVENPNPYGRGLRQRAETAIYGAHSGPIGPSPRL